MDIYCKEQAPQVSTDSVPLPSHTLTVDQLIWPELSETRSDSEHFSFSLSLLGPGHHHLGQAQSKECSKEFQQALIDQFRPLWSILPLYPIYRGEVVGWRH